MFVYCFNNPVNMSDPNGNWPRWITATVAVVSTLLTPGFPNSLAVASSVAYVAQSHHYDKREEKNNNLPQTPQEANDLNWINSKPKTEQNLNGGGPADDFHQFTSPDNSNIKYVSPDGHREVIYDSAGKIVSDSKDVGTYNFSPSGGFWGTVGHIGLDVIPWFVFGNDDDDPGPIVNFVISLFE